MDYSPLPSIQPLRLFCDGNDDVAAFSGEVDIALPLGPCRIIDGQREFQRHDPWRYTRQLDEKVECTQTAAALRTVLRLVVFGYDDGIFLLRRGNSVIAAAVQDDTGVHDAQHGCLFIVLPEEPFGILVRFGIERERNVLSRTLCRAGKTAAFAYSGSDRADVIRRLNRRLRIACMQAQ